MDIQSLETLYKLDLGIGEASPVRVVLAICVAERSSLCGLDLYVEMRLPPKVVYSAIRPPVSTAIEELHVVRIYHSGQLERHLGEREAAMLSDLHFLLCEASYRLPGHTRGPSAKGWLACLTS